MVRKHWEDIEAEIEYEIMREHGMIDDSHLTAMKRSGPSYPMRKLDEMGLLKVRLLDYGCGHGDDAKYYGATAYDPYYFPSKPRGKFDTITCNYVLNVVSSKEERQRIIDRIYDYLRPGGTAYISVRTDKKSLNGNTKRGTWQGLIELDLEVVHRGKHMIMYKLEKE